VPSSYQEAISDPVFGTQWEHAIEEEKENLLAHGTWEYIDAADLPKEGSQLVAVGCSR
jgi:hypothetical protein